MTEPIESLLELMGSIDELAKHTGVSKSAITRQVIKMLANPKVMKEIEEALEEADALRLE